MQCVGGGFVVRDNLLQQTERRKVHRVGEYLKQFIISINVTLTLTYLINVI